MHLGTEVLHGAGGEELLEDSALVVEVRLVGLEVDGGLGVGGDGEVVVFLGYGPIEFYEEVVLPRLQPLHLDPTLPLPLHLTHHIPKPTAIYLCQTHPHIRVLTLVDTLAGLHH